MYQQTACLGFHLLFCPLEKKSAKVQKERNEKSNERRNTEQGGKEIGKKYSDSSLV